VAIHHEIEGREEMDVLSALVVSALLVSPASGGNLLAKDVWTVQVNMDWTEIYPGIEIMIDGLLHNTLLIFSTNDPVIFRLVGLTTFHGTIGMRGYDPLIGSFLFLETDKVYQSRAVGMLALNETGVLVLVDGMLSLRALGSLTFIVGDIVLVLGYNLFLLIKMSNGEIVWAKAGVPMGWPFQMPALSAQTSMNLSQAILIG